jgi:hypothetical protein
MALEAYRSALDLEANETLLLRSKELEDRICMINLTDVR